MEQFGFSDLHYSIVNFKSLQLFETQLHTTPRTVINEQDSQGRTALSWASFFGNIEVMARLLQRGADPNVADLEGHTPLHCAVFNEGHPLAVKCLIEAGANTNAWNFYNESVIYGAVRCNSIISLKLLLDAGADYTTINKDGWNILHFAAQFSDMRMLSVLRQAELFGLDIDLKVWAGRTLTDLALWRRDENEKWSNWARRCTDEDPLAWFCAFEDLIDSVRANNAADYFSDFIALANNGICWGEENAVHEQRGVWDNMLGSFPIDD